MPAPTVITLSVLMDGVKSDTLTLQAPVDASAVVVASIVGASDTVTVAPFSAVPEAKTSSPDVFIASK